MCTCLGLNITQTDMLLFSLVSYPQICQLYGEMVNVKQPDNHTLLAGDEEFQLFILSS